MRRAVTYFLTAVFLLALLSFTVTYTVKFTEAGVLTTFGKADKGDLRTEPGLYFKMPYPIQAVTVYDKRLRVLTNKFEQLATADNRQVAVETFCLWKVEDPLAFFKTFSNAGPRAEEHYRKAEDALRQNLRAAAALVSQYRMDELFSGGKSGSKLAELQGKMLDVFRGSADQSGLKLSDYGVKAEDLGLMRVVLTEEVTKAVIERMKSSRDKIVKETQSQGQARASGIRKDADTDADRIEAFANRLAQNIRTQGDQEAVAFLSQMKENPQLAVFQSNMDFIRDVYAKRMTMVVSGSMPGIWMLMPNAMDSLTSGQVPPLVKPEVAKATRAQPTPAGRETGSTPGGGR